MKQGIFFILSAPSGAGKTTLVRRLLHRNKQLVRSISVTTRPPRADEIDGCDYFFVARREFLQRRRRGEFLESARVFSHYYGTPRQFVIESIRTGKDVITCLDVQGAKQVKRQWPEAVSIFVLPPKADELIQRLKKRKTDSVRQIQARLRKAKWEMVHRDEYDYQIVNDRLSKAVEALQAIMTIERKRRK